MIGKVPAPEAASSEAAQVFLNTGILSLPHRVASAARRQAVLEGDGDALRQ
jgi:hypothetical protein